MSRTVWTDTARDDLAAIDDHYAPSAQRSPIASAAKLSPRGAFWPHIQQQARR